MVTMYGLNDRIGNISYYDSTGQSEYSFGKPYSEQTAKTIDEEVSRIVEGQYARAKRILSENKDKLTALAMKLLEMEVIFKEDLEKIFGKRAWEREEQAIKPHEPLNPTNGNGSHIEKQPEAKRPEQPDTTAPTPA